MQEWLVGKGRGEIKVDVEDVYGRGLLDRIVETGLIKIFYGDL